ncbi:MAG: lycopene cyclase domain-containing protein [Halobacteriaceae archaeon]
MVALTYLQFDVLFLLVPVALLAVHRYQLDQVAGPSVRLGVPLLVVVALLYTTPWDSYLIDRGVWWYGDVASVQAWLWGVPAEELAFVCLQATMTGLWFGALRDDADWTTAPTRRQRVVGVAAGGAVAGAGAWLLGVPGGYYLAAILLWAAPVLALQWGFGWPVLWHHRRTVAVGVLLPTAYLATVDAFAIASGLWVLSTVHTTGILIGGYLPVEEVTFFLVTNLFVVQGLILLRWLIERVDASAVPRPDQSDSADFASRSR